MDIEPDLREELEWACLDATRGDPPGPALAGRLERSVRTVLLNRGIKGAQVQARSDRRETSVRILLKKPGAKVKQVVLTLA